MKSLLFLALLIGVARVGMAQYIPVAQTYSSSAIANYVQQNYTTDRQKLKAIYHWVTTNIRYDTDSMYNINWGKEPEEKVAATLRRKKGVCENYAAVFADIAEKVGIPAVVITGYSLQFTPNKNTGHSWTAVNVDNEWLLCDPTWDVGVANGTNYFLVSPETFIDTHMPFDPLWQLLSFPILPAHDNSKIGFENYSRLAWAVKDSVNNFLLLDSLQQLEAATKRIQFYGAKNEVADGWAAYLKMKIAIVYGDKDRTLYNAAVEDLNGANHIFNGYVQYRNNQFLPAKPPAEIYALLSPIAGIIFSAKNKLNQMGKVVANEQYDTSEINQRLHALSARVKAEQQYLKNYFAANAAR